MPSRHSKASYVMHITGRYDLTLQANAMTSTTMTLLPRTPTPEEQAIAEERRRRLVAAMQAAGVSQSELHRRLVDLDERTSLATVNRWCNGKYAISEVTLRGILTVLGLPADWQAPPKSAADG
jgi:hypothetical protein